MVRHKENDASNERVKLTAAISILSCARIADAVGPRFLYQQNTEPTSKLTRMQSARTTFVHVPTNSKLGVDTRRSTDMPDRTVLPVSDGGKLIRKQPTRRLKNGATVFNEKGPQMVGQDRPPPLFLEGAVSRAFSQPITKRIRSLIAIGKSILETAFWWAFRAPYLAPALIGARRNMVGRIDVPLNGVTSTSNERNEDQLESSREYRLSPALDIYAQPQIAGEILDLLSGESASDARALGEVNTVVLYVHGGAWGSGSADQYAPLANLLLNRSSSSRICVCVLSYTLYPHADIHDQASQVGHTLKFLRSRLPPYCKVVVLAHSSGANVAMLALLNDAIVESSASCHGNRLADVAMLSAPPMDLAHHFLFESRRGVALVSPMLPAARAEDDASRFDAVSPTVILERLQGTLYNDDIEANRHLLIPHFLEGDIAGSSLCLPPVNREMPTVEGTVTPTRKVSPFPQIAVLASSCDTVVPFYSALRFAGALRNKGVNARFLVYDGVQHGEFVTDWFERVINDNDDSHSVDEKNGTVIIDKNETLRRTLDVSMKDVQIRKNVLNHVLNSVVGSDGCKQRVMYPQRLSAAAAHVRDVLRIIDSVSSIAEVERQAEQV